MKILKGKYENGQVSLTEPAPEPGPVDVEVVFLDPEDRRWDEIIRDPRPRPALSAEADQVLEDYRAGKTAPGPRQALNSRTHPRFWDRYRKLPAHVQEEARKVYRLFRQNPAHPSLRFERLVYDSRLWSVRVTSSYRAVGLREGEIEQCSSRTVRHCKSDYRQ